MGEPHSLSADLEKGVARAAAEIASSTPAVSPRELAKESQPEVGQAIQYSIRAHCRCGRQIARKVGSKSGKGHCVRFLTGEGVSKICQKNLDAKSIMWEKPKVAPNPNELPLED
jgi:hypothetical protein